MARRSNPHPKTVIRVHRARIEFLRAQGRYRELVLWLIGEPEVQRERNGVFESRVVRSRPDLEPTPEDLAGALREESPEPLPEPIREWMIAHDLLKTKRRKRGPKTSARSTSDDDQIADIYASEYLTALAEYEAREAPPDDQTAAPGVATQAKKRTVERSGWSARTIDDVLAARQIVKSPKK